MAPILPAARSSSAQGHNGRISLREFRAALRGATFDQALGLRIGRLRAIRGVRVTARDTTGELAFLTRALKAPTLRECVSWLADRAPEQSWTFEEFSPPACNARFRRVSHGGEGRIRAAQFPARKSLAEFAFDHPRGLEREVVAHLGTLDFITAKENVIFLGPPGTGIATRACRAPCPVRHRL